MRDEFGFGDRIFATVKLRRGHRFRVRPEAEALEGLRHEFSFGWDIDEADRLQYAGEVAWVPSRDSWPDNAPTWLASGDLVEIEHISLKEQE